MCNHRLELGIKAALKHVFGTDTEIRMKHGGISEELEHARAAVGQMAEGAETLLKQLDETNKRPIDSMEKTFEALVRDL